MSANIPNQNKIFKGEMLGIKQQRSIHLIKKIAISTEIVHSKFQDYHHWNSNK